MNEAERGLLPAEATVVVGQPLTIDSSRAPDGRGLLWIQLQELPWRIKGDAAGEIDTGSGEWTDELRERYADRIQARIARHIPNFESSILKRVALGPHDLQRANVNLRHGDPYGGSLALDQNFLWRPCRRARAMRRRSSASGRSARARGRGRASAAARGRSSRSKLLEPPLTQRAVARVRGLAALVAICLATSSAVTPSSAGVQRRAAAAAVLDLAGEHAHRELR